MKEEQINEFLEFIRKEFLEPLWEELKPALKDIATETIKGVSKESIPKLKQFVKDLLKARNIKFENVDELVKSDIISLTRLHMVSDSDGVAALKQTKGGKTVIYFAYCKGRCLIPEDKNCYIVVEAQKLNKDVEELFDESDLIILK